MSCHVRNGDSWADENDDDVDDNDRDNKSNNDADHNKDDHSNNHQEKKQTKVLFWYWCFSPHTLRGGLRCVAFSHLSEEFSIKNFYQTKYNKV